MDIIEVMKLSYNYPDGAQALRNVSFRVTEGKSLALIGRNGAGKSTLLLHLNGIFGGSGAVRFRGTPIEELPAAQLRASVGLVFEDPSDQLFMPTVLDDVTFGPMNMGLRPAEAEARAREALASVGAEHLAPRAPHHLSAGQMRRVALASVLVMDPEVLVLDEPVAGLDPEGREAVIELLAGLAQTKIIATHDLDLVAQLCDEALVLDEGRVQAQGPARELLTNDSLLRAHGLRVPPSLRLLPPLSHVSEDELVMDQQLVDRLRAFHGHLGPFAMLGYRAGKLALAHLQAPSHFGVRAHVLCPLKTPQSCFIDGIQYGSGCTMGKNNISVEASDGIEVTVTVDDGGASVVIRPRPEVYLSFGEWMEEGSDETAALRVLAMTDDELFEPRA